MHLLSYIHMETNWLKSYMKLISFQKCVFCAFPSDNVNYSWIYYGYSVIIKHALLNVRSTLKSYLHFKISNIYIHIWFLSKDWTMILFKRLDFWKDQTNLLEFKIITLLCSVSLDIWNFEDRRYKGKKEVTF